eukprot:2924093-Rhodomonas_salina.3
MSGTDIGYAATRPEATAYGDHPTRRGRDLVLCWKAARWKADRQAGSGRAGAALGARGRARPDLAHQPEVSDSAARDGGCVCIGDCWDVCAGYDVCVCVWYDEVGVCQIRMCCSGIGVCCVFAATPQCRSDVQDAAPGAMCICICDGQSRGVGTTAFPVNCRVLIAGVQRVGSAE